MPQPPPWWMRYQGTGTTARPSAGGDFRPTFRAPAAPSQQWRRDDYNAETGEYTWRNLRTGRNVITTNPYPPGAEIPPQQFDPGLPPPPTEEDLGFDVAPPLPEAPARPSPTAAPTAGPQATAGVLPTPPGGIYAPPPGGGNAYLPSPTPQGTQDVTPSPFPQATPSPLPSPTEVPTFENQFIYPTETPTLENQVIYPTEVPTLTPQTIYPDVAPSAGVGAAPINPPPVEGGPSASYFYNPPPNEGPNVAAPNDVYQQAQPEGVQWSVTPDQWNQMMGELGPGAPVAGGQTPDEWNQMMNELAPPGVGDTGTTTATGGEAPPSDAEQLLSPGQHTPLYPSTEDIFPGAEGHAGGFFRDAAGNIVDAAGNILSGAGDAFSQFVDNILSNASNTDPGYLYSMGYRGDYAGGALWPTATGQVVVPGTYNVGNLGGDAVVQAGYFTRGVPMGYWEDPRLTAAQRAATAAGSPGGANLTPNEYSRLFTQALGSETGLRGNTGIWHPYSPEYRSQLIAAMAANTAAHADTSQFTPGGARTSRGTPPSSTQ